MEAPQLTTATPHMQVTFCTNIIIFLYNRRCHTQGRMLIGAIMPVWKHDLGIGEHNIGEANAIPFGRVPQ